MSQMKSPPVRARVITCSDSAVRGERADASGPAVRDILERSGYLVDRVEVVPDSVQEISDAIASATDLGGCLLVVTTGGTGIAPRDVTPEATMRIADRRIDGFGELMRLRSLEKTPLAPLSRAQAATRGHALIVNVPGSPKGAVENLEAILHLVPHTLRLLAGGRVDEHPGASK
ncbi:MAG: MogA/MoaB family molybdenum cofactor biosynthesis protein [Acidobacteria bacterium]|nr:MogA/MoaB family molybdenum cofactor biosynthesis protein [Acidobacteriota bacterium]